MRRSLRWTTLSWASALFGNVPGGMPWRIGTSVLKNKPRRRPSSDTTPDEHDDPKTLERVPLSECKCFMQLTVGSMTMSRQPWNSGGAFTRSSNNDINLDGAWKCVCVLSQP